LTVGIINNSQIESLNYLQTFKKHKIMRNELTLRSAKLVSGGKIALGFTQVVNTKNRATSLLSLLNASDERFAKAGERWCFLNAEPTDATNITGVDFSSLKEEGDEMKDINIVMSQVQGQDLNIQVLETTQGNEYEVANIATTAKRAGKDGEYILTEGGEFIYQRTTIVLGEPKHILIDGVIATQSLESATAEALK